MKKLDIMNMRDGGDTKPGEDYPWQIIDGKVTKVEKSKGATATVDGKGLRYNEKSGKWDKEIRVEGPVVQEAIEEIVIVKEERKKKQQKRKKRGGSKRTKK